MVRCSAFAFGVVATVVIWLSPATSPWFAEARNISASECSHTSADNGSSSGARRKPALAIFLQLGKTTSHLFRDATCNFTIGRTCQALSLHSCPKTRDIAKQGLCPSDCSYTLVDPYMPCEAACVAPTDCALGGPIWTYPDPALHRCVQSPIVGCRGYTAPSANYTGAVPMCDVCGSLYRRTDDGGCEFSMYGFKWFFRGVFGACLVFLFYVAGMSVHRAMQPEGCPPVLQLAWAHWRRCLVSIWGYADPTKAHEMFSLRTNMHKVPVAGAGLCLYYNALVFVGICLLAFVLALSPIFLTAPSALFDEDPNGTCRFHSPADIDSASSDLLDFHFKLAQVLGMIWVVLVIGALLFAMFQRFAFKSLDARTNLMSDFGIHASGFPPDVTEEDIMLWTVSFAPRDANCYGVSIAYDYGHKHAWVENEMAKLMEKQELRWWRVQEAAPVGANEGAEEDVKSNEAHFVQYTLKSFKCSGTVYLVFATEEARVKCYQAFIEKQKPAFRGTHIIKMRAVIGEPLNFVWHAMGTTWNEFCYKFLRESSMVLGCCFLLSFVGYLPASYYMVHVAHSTGDENEYDVVTCMLGLLIAVLNGLLFAVMNMAVRRVGLPSKWMADAANMIGCIVITGLNTLFNLAICHSAAASAHRLLLLDEGKGQVLRDFAWRRVLADKFWNLAVPGLLVLPYALYPLYKYILGISAAFHYYIDMPGKRDIRSNPKVELRDVESKLEPAAMQLEFDFANIIIVVGTGMTTLFFDTGHMLQVGCVLVFWVFLTYGSQVYCHLRWNKLVEYTTPFLAETFNFMWAIPVSMVAAASAYWGEQSGAMGAGISPYVFCLALSCHWLLLLIIYSQLPIISDLGTATVEEVGRLLRYDYFNTNPVHVLRKVHLEGCEMVYFKRGKEYLQRGMPNDELRISKSMRKSGTADMDTRNEISPHPSLPQYDESQKAKRFKISGCC